MQDARMEKSFDGTKQVAALHIPSALRGAAALVKHIPIVNFGAEVTGLSRIRLYQLRGPRSGASTLTVAAWGTRAGGLVGYGDRV